MQTTENQITITKLPVADCLMFDLHIDKEKTRWGGGGGQWQTI